MKVIIPMAGRGTRLRPHTLTIPKPLLPIGGKPIVQHLVEELSMSFDEKIDELAFIIGDFGEQVEKDLVAVAEELGAKTLLLGSPEEAPTITAVAEAANTPVLNLINAGLSLESLRGVIERADLLITNDTGPRHLAAALGTQAIVLFGPTDHRWTSLSGVDETLLLAEPFLDEAHLADDHAQMCSVERIAVGDVLFHARKRLALGANT